MLTIGSYKRFTVFCKNTDSSKMVSVQGAVHHKWPFHRYWQDPVDHHLVVRLWKGKRGRRKKRRKKRTMRQWRQFSMQLPVVTSWLLFPYASIVDFLITKDTSMSLLNSAMWCG